MQSRSENEVVLFHEGQAAPVMAMASWGRGEGFGVGKESGACWGAL